MDLGWDRIDVENYILLYNHKNNKNVPIPDFKRKKDIYGKKNEKKKNENKNDRCKERKDEGIESDSNGDSSDGRGVKKRSDKAKEQKS